MTPDDAHFILERTADFSIRIEELQKEVRRLQAIEKEFEIYKKAIKGRLLAGALEREGES